MAFQFDGNGKISITDIVTALPFNIQIPAFEYFNGTKFLIGRASAFTDYIGMFADGVIKARLNGVEIQITIPSIQEGDFITDLVITRDVNSLVTLSAAGVTNSATISEPLTINDIGSAGGTTTAKYNGLMYGNLIVEYGSRNSSYNFSATSGSTLVDSNGGEAGVLNGFTTGGFVANPSVASSTITFDIPAEIQGKANVKYIVVSETLNIAYKSGDLDTSASSVTIDLATLAAGIPAVTNGQVLHVYASDKHIAPTTPIVMWDDSVAAVVGV